MHDLSLGVNFNMTLGAAFLEQEKVERTLERLRLLVVGQLEVGDYRSLLGLMLHVAFLADLKFSELHGMFAPLSHDGCLSHGPRTLVAGEYLTPVIVQCGHRWIARLQVRWGAPFAAAVPELSASALGPSHPLV